MAKSKTKSPLTSKAKPGPAKTPPAAKPAATKAKASTAATKQKPVPAPPPKATPTPASKPPPPKPGPAQKPGPKKQGGNGGTYSVAEMTNASAAVAFHVIVLGPNGTTTYTEDTRELVIGPPTWVAVVPVPATVRRYTYLLQKEDSPSGRIVLLQMIDGSGVTRIPAGNGWIRAIIEGTFHLIESDLLLNREDFVAIIGGHEPPPVEARPPFT